MDDIPPTYRDTLLMAMAMQGPVDTMNIIKRADLFPRKAPKVDLSRGGGFRSFELKKKKNVDN